MSELLSAHADLTSVKDFLIAEFNSASSYDYIITCFEPIGKVHGGIGTYTRLLLEMNSTAKILLISGTREDEYHGSLVNEHPNVSVVVLDREIYSGRNSINFVSDVYNKFAFNVMRYLLHLKRQGVGFHAVEFPDYGAEGYFAIRAKKALLLEIDAYVRLHSPNFMLFHDNQRALSDYTDAVVEMSSYELGALRDADHILYGVDAMRDHVFQIAEEVYDVVLDRSRAIKLPHPWPHVKGSDSAVSFLVKNDRKFSSTKQNVGLIGRLEPRKGCVRFARKLSAAVMEGRCDGRSLKLHFFGADTEAPGVPSVQKIVGDLLAAAGVEAHFWGRLDQTVLWEAARECDALIFPSLFENYPNALLEALQFDIPMLVSQDGGMPEIASGFENVLSYSSQNSEELTKFLSTIRMKAEKTTKLRLGAGLLKSKAPVYEKTAERFNRQISNFIAERVGHSASPSTRQETFSQKCGVIIPHFRDVWHLRQCIESVMPQLHSGDEIIVVDDCSGNEFDIQIEELKEWLSARATEFGLGARIVKRETNGGPGAARNDGAKNSRSDYLIFVDCDDLLAPGAVSLMRRYLDANDGVDAAAGIMKAFGIENHYWCPKDGIRDLIMFKNVSHCGIIIRRSVFLDVMYNENRLPHYEDWEFMMRMILSGGRFEAIPAVTYFYRMLASLTRNRANAHYAEYSRSQIISNTLNFLARRELPISKSLLGRLIGQVSGLDRNILHPDVYADVNDLPKQVASSFSSSSRFDGLVAIDFARIEDKKFVVIGWLASATENVHFLAGRGPRIISLQHFQMERSDADRHLEEIGSEMRAYGFQFELPLSEIQWLGEEGVVYVRIGENVMELDKVRKFTERALN